MVRRHQLLRPELERQLVDFAGEVERQLVAIVHRCAGIAADVKGLINGHQKRDRVLHCLPRQLLTVHREYAGATLAWTGTIVLEIERDRVLTSRQFLTQEIHTTHPTLPAGSFQIEEVINEDRLAFEQVQTISAEDAAHGYDHPFRTAFRNSHFRSDGVVLVQEAWRIAHRNA